jgi:NAD(P)-dependent dehydrogenase (short-subunit alcohol dehydrogenase family)
MNGLSGRTALVTGATDGLGRAVAGRLAADGATVLLHGRDRARLDAAASEIRDATGSEVRTYLADFAELAQVRRLAAEVRDTTGRLNILVSNAGVGSGLPERRERQLSADGYELRFAVNYLAPFLLTLELLPLVEASAPARIVNVASIGQYPIDFDDVMLERGYDGQRAYAQSKLAQIMSGFELAARIPADRVTVNSLHPATYMPTKIVTQERGATVDELETGTAAVVRLAASPELEGVTGRYYEWQGEARANPQAYDADVRQRLWKLSIELTRAPSDTWT